MLSVRLNNFAIERIVSPLFIKKQIIKYKILSTAANVYGNCKRISPVLLKGSGQIKFAKNVNIGVALSPHFYNSYCHIEARLPTSSINIGNNVYINNNACIISEGEGIRIGDDVLIGPNFLVFDSDFHQLDPFDRLLGKPRTAEVVINNNVFIGANVTVLKGVTIGVNSVIAINSVVTKSIPSNVIAGGNPCRVLKAI